VLCHSDYRYGNPLVDPETGETQAVLDWGLLSAAAPAYNLAKTESFLLSPDRDSPDVVARLRERFRSAYTRRREGWSFDEPTRERMRLYESTRCRVSRCGTRTPPPPSASRSRTGTVRSSRSISEFVTPSGAEV